MSIVDDVEHVAFKAKHREPLSLDELVDLGETIPFREDGVEVKMGNGQVVDVLSFKGDRKEGGFTVSINSIIRKD